MFSRKVSRICDTYACENCSEYFFCPLVARKTEPYLELSYETQYSHEDFWGSNILGWISILRIYTVAFSLSVWEHWVWLYLLHIDHLCDGVTCDTLITSLMMLPVILPCMLIILLSTLNVTGLLIYGNSLSHLLNLNLTFETVCIGGRKWFIDFKGTVMQIEKRLVNDRLRASKVSWRFPIPTIYNFALICPWNLLFSLKVLYFLTVSIIFSVYQQNFTAQEIKN